MRNILVTGFPGFIARLLVRAVADRADSVSLLVEDRFQSTAEEAVRHLAGLLGLPRDRFHLVVGDITRRDLALPPAEAERLQAEVDTVFHLAAVYDLAVPEAVARRVNVDGTQNVNRFVAGMAALERYNYVSTFAVAGRRRGIVREAELEHDAGFHNHYESTKYEAEIAVRELAASGVPTSIFRPAVVVGSSRTGRTIKYDGPYMVLRMMRDLPYPLSHLNLGSREVRFQLVPVDFVVDAMVAIARRPDSAGRTYHLTDPDPHTTAEIFDLFCESLHGRPCLARVPGPLTRAVTATGVTELLGVQRQAGPYFFHRYRFDCINTLDALDGTGVHCPPLQSYVDTIVTFFRDHPEFG